MWGELKRRWGTFKGLIGRTTKKELFCGFLKSDGGDKKILKKSNNPSEITYKIKTKTNQCFKLVTSHDLGVGGTLPEQFGGVRRILKKAFKKAEGVRTLHLLMGTTTNCIVEVGR